MLEVERLLSEGLSFMMLLSVVGMWLESVVFVLSEKLMMLCVMVMLDLLFELLGMMLGLMVFVGIG